MKFDFCFRDYNSIKGDNTVPLITKLVDHEVRNDNLIEVYERLKFIAKECFKASTEDFYKLNLVLKEIDLYLRNYECNNEDSEYDSDEEVFAITISKDLKTVIEEKLDLGSQISEVERSLIAWNSNNSGERKDSIITSPDFNKSKTSSISKGARLIEEGSNKNENKSLNDLKDNSLYK